MRNLIFILVMAIMSSVCFGAPVAVDDVFVSSGYLEKCANGKWSYKCTPTPVIPDGIIFQENFNDQIDWKVATSSESCNLIGTCNTTLPANFTYLRNAESWHPDESDPTKQPSQQINNTQFEGASGKSWIRYHESVGTNSSTFSDDTLLLKDLEEELTEVYLSFDIKFDPNWQWNLNDNAKFKLVRLQHFDGPPGVASPWEFFKEGDNAPVMVLDIKHSNTYGMRWAWARRCDPQETVYDCDGRSDADSDPAMTCPDDTICTGPFGYPTHAEMFGTEWHTIVVRVKMNTVLDVYDGIFELWFDGKPNVSKTDINWLRAGSDLNIGFNMFGLGGNTTNWYSDPSNKDEQWYAIDNIVITTVREDVL